MEEKRRLLRLSQQQIARALNVSQGHYSKVITSKVPLTEKLSTRMRAWLEANDAASIGDDASERVRALAASIRRECMELMHIVGLAFPASL